MSRPDQREPEALLPSRYLSPTELAELLGVPVQTVYQWRHQGDGPPGFRIGKHLRYDPRAVRRWIDGLSRRAG
ncbi:MAG TPA: helix-turn-helix domain-containing protein [Acidimicrobiales bacterium]|nr:helix-turn-helix domain-containing protein [Acidimicrobiales bacterium]